MINGTRVLAVVIGRAGSKGLPGKNAMPLAGRPAVAWSVADALMAETVDRVVVSTDGEAIAQAAREAGAEVLTRPPHLASDTATVDAAVRHAVESSGEEAGIIVILYANVPVRPPGLIDRAVSLLDETCADSVQSYAGVGKHHPWWMVTIDEAGRVTPNVPNSVYRRQDLPPLFLPDGGVIAVTRRSLFKVDPARPHAFLGNDRRAVINPDGAVIDIDSPADARVAEALLMMRSGAAVDAHAPSRILTI